MCLIMLQPAKMCILYVDEHLSIERQLNRGRQAIEHNRRVQETGEGKGDGGGRQGRLAWGPVRRDQ